VTHQQALDAQAAERYLLDEMSEIERYQFEEHYFDCPECAEEMRVMSILRQQAEPRLSPAAAAAPPPAHVPSRAAWRPSSFVPLAAAAVLGVALGYQALFVIPSLRQSAGARALAPVMLAPATRGALPVVRPDDHPVVSLAMDVDVVAEGGGALRYTVRGPDDEDVASGNAPVPPPGTPLVLVIPTARLARPGTYTASLEGAGAGTTQRLEYRFAVDHN
jgi:hypothetical protein